MVLGVTILLILTLMTKYVYVLVTVDIVVWVTRSLWGLTLTSAPLGTTGKTEINLQVAPELTSSPTSQGPPPPTPPSTHLRHHPALSPPTPVWGVFCF